MLMLMTDGKYKYLKMPALQENIVTTHGNSACRILCINCTRCMKLVYTKCVQNVYKMYPTFRQTFVERLWQLNFV